MKARLTLSCGLLAAGLLASPGCGRQETDELRGPVGVASPAPATQPRAAAAEAPAIHPHASATQPRTKARASEWTQPADRKTFNLDFEVTNQDGQVLKLADLRGTPMAVIFFFTRCPNPSMCPLTISTLASLQKRLEREGLGEKVRLVAISYDPVHDTPARLKEYGSNRGLAFDNAMLLRAKPEEFRDLLVELGASMSYTETGDINHYLELVLIDRAGRYVRDYQGDMWDAAAVTEDLRRLAEEPDSPATQPQAAR